MRQYDYISQRLFSADHPVWISRMVTAKGKPKRRFDPKQAAQLEAEGLIKLVPSVTTVAKIADMGGFSAGSRWGMEIGVDATLDAWDDVTINRPEGIYLWKDAAQTLAQERMTEARDKGSELHGVFDDVTRGRKILDDLTEDQYRFFHVAAELVQGLGVDEFETEKVFVTEEYGGTADVSGQERGLDFKTVAKFRPARTSELLQLGAYAHALNWHNATIAYIRQSDFAALTAHFPQDALTQFYEAFCVALAMYQAVEELKPSTKVET